MTEVVLPLLLVLGALALGVAVRRREAVNDTWQEAARQLHLQVQPGGLLKTGTIAGPVKGVFVRVDAYPRGKGNATAAYTRVVVDGSGEGCPDGEACVRRPGWDWGICLR